MNHDPVAIIVAKLQAAGCDPQSTGPGSWESRCPSHHGTRRNLSVKRADDGRALICCHHVGGSGHGGGCDHKAIVAALGLAEADLFPPRDPSRNGAAKPSVNGRPAKAARRAHPTPEAAIAGLVKQHGQPSGCWPYHDADGHEVLRVYRFDFVNSKTGKSDKTYRPVHPTPQGWTMGDPPGPLTLYRLPELAGATRVFVGEGEKAVDAARSLGLVATTSAHGAKSTRKSDWSPLAGKEVVILPDADAAGEGYARAVLALLAPLDPRPTVKIVRLPGLSEGEDLVEWVAALPQDWGPDQARAELERLADAAPVEDLDSLVSPDPPARVDADDAEDWPPLRLGEIPQAEPFPTDALPPPVAEFVEVVAGAIGCPPDYVGLPAIIVAGAAVGRSVALLLKPNYFVSTSLYGMNVGGPSSGKSPALDAAVRPMWDIDEALDEQYRQRKSEFDSLIEAHKTAPKDSKPPLPAKPVIESAVLDDVTAETVAPHLAINPRGLLLSRDEGSGWVAAFGQYKQGRGSDRQFWLAALFGKPVRVDRKGNPDLVPIRVPCPFLSVLGNVTPDMLSEFRENRGRADGFIERILFVWPDPRPKPYWSDAGMPEEVMRTWAEIVQRLRSRPMTVSEGKSHPHPLVIRFSPEAKAAWVSWYNSHVNEVNSPEFDQSELAIEGQLCDFAARLALILHMLHVGTDPTRKDSDPIPPDSRMAVNGAIRLWSYFRNHHRRVRWRMNGGIDNPTAREILDWAMRNERASFTVKELIDNLRWLSKKPNEPDAALFWLEQRGAIRRCRPASDRPEGTRGRKPYPSFELHPELVSRNSRCSRNSSPEPPGDLLTVAQRRLLVWDLQTGLGEEGSDQLGLCRRRPIARINSWCNSSRSRHTKLPLSTFLR